MRRAVTIAISGIEGLPDQLANPAAQVVVSACSAAETAPKRLLIERSGLVHVQSTLFEQGEAYVGASLCGSQNSQPNRQEDVGLESERLQHVHQKQLAETFEAIERAHGKGTVLFHCISGKDRSPTLAFAYLLQCGYTAKQAFNTIAKVRPQVEYGLHSAHYIAGFVRTMTGVDFVEEVKNFTRVSKALEDAAQTYVQGHTQIVLGLMDQWALAARMGAREIEEYTQRYWGQTPIQIACRMIPKIPQI